MDSAPIASLNTQPPPNRAATGCCLGCLALVALFAGLLTLLLIGSEIGAHSLAIGMVLACLPVPLYVGLALWVDRYEPEPIHLLISAFLWGAGLAVFASYILNTMNSVIAYQATQNLKAASALGAVVSAPVVEEFAKGLFLFGLFFLKRKEFDGIVDGVVYATMVALGFAMTENIQYYGKALRSGSDAAGAVFILRGMISPYSHPLFTSMTGIGLGWAAQTRHLAIKILAPLGGLALAMFLHAVWNLSATIHGYAWMASYLLIMMPSALVVFIILGFALAREGRLIRHHLAHDLFPEDLKIASSIWRRIGYAVGKLFTKGPRGWWNAEQYLQTASELAFLRDRTDRGFKPDPHLEQALITRIALLHNQLN